MSSTKSTSKSTKKKHRNNKTYRKISFYEFLCGVPPKRKKQLVLKKNIANQTETGPTKYHILTDIDIVNKNYVDLSQNVVKRLQEVKVSPSIISSTVQNKFRKYEPDKASLQSPLSPETSSLNSMSTLKDLLELTDPSSYESHHQTRKNVQQVSSGSVGFDFGAPSHYTDTVASRSYENRNTYESVQPLSADYDNLMAGIKYNESDVRKLNAATINYSTMPEDESLRVHVNYNEQNIRPVSSTMTYTRPLNNRAYQDQHDNISIRSVPPLYPNQPIIQHTYHRTTTNTLNSQPIIKQNQQRMTLNSPAIIMRNQQQRSSNSQTFVRQNEQRMTLNSPPIIKVNDEAISPNSTLSPKYQTAYKKPPSSLIMSLSRNMNSNVGTGQPQFPANLQRTASLEMGRYDSLPTKSSLQKRRSSGDYSSSYNSTAF